MKFQGIKIPAPLEIRQTQTYEGKFETNLGLEYVPTGKLESEQHFVAAVETPVSSGVLERVDLRSTVDV